MRNLRDWSTAAKLFTISLVLFLIAIGLCGAGGGFDTQVTQTQVAMSYVGAFPWLVAFILLLYGCSEIGKKRRNRKP